MNHNTNKQPNYIASNRTATLFGGLLGALLLCATPVVQAGALYFDDAGGPKTWDNATTANWSGTTGGPYSSIWSGGSDAHFEGTPGTVNGSGTIASVNLISFDINGYTLAGGTITLSGSCVITNVGSGSNTINSQIAGTALTKTGAGTLTLGGANTYTGTTTLLNGKLVLDAVNAIPSNKTLSVGGSVGTTNNTSLDVNYNQTLVSLSYRFSDLPAAGGGHYTHTNTIKSGVTLTTSDFSSGIIKKNATAGSGSSTLNIKGDVPGAGTLIVNAGSADIVVNTSESGYY
jgi:fibronectin-binding autotransporter adhesin